MEWSDLPVLLALSRSRTMTEAAKRLSVNQTTVARRLDALEGALGVRLVERRRDGIVLTEDGREAVRAAEQMEGLAFDLERNLLGGSARLDGVVRVTTTDEISLHHAELIGSFVEEYPNIDVEMIVGYGLASLAKREADVALRMTLKPGPTLFGRKLATVEYGVYGAKALKKGMKRGASLEDYPWLAPTLASGAKVTERWLRKNVPKARIVCRYSNMSALGAGVRAGIGIAFMPCIYGDTDPGLVRLRGPEPGFGYDLWALTHQDLSGTARVRSFLKHAGDYFSARRGLFEGRGK